MTATAEAKGTPAVSASCEPLIVADSVTSSVVREDGLVGQLFRPAGPGPHPGVILLRGSEGGLIASYAAFVASHGFLTLALAYFAYDGLPEVLRRIPLEYFQKAIIWLQEQRDVKGGGVALFGYSRCGELALLLGATFFRGESSRRCRAEPCRLVGLRRRRAGRQRLVTSRSSCPDDAPRSSASGHFQTPADSESNRVNRSCTTVHRRTPR